MPNSLPKLVRCNALVLLIHVAVLSTTSYSQTAPPVTIYDAFSGFEERIAAEVELSDLAYTRADIAARSGNIQVLQEALDRIKTLPGGSVDRIIGTLSLPFPEGVNTVSDRRRFLIEVVLPYLYTDRIGATFECGQRPRFSSFLVIDGVLSEESTENAYVCVNGNLSITSIVRESVSTSRLGTDVNWTSALQISSPFGRAYYPDGDRFFTAAPDKPAHTLLAGAAATNQLDIVTLLLDAGADVDIPSDSGFTALHYAVQENHLDAVRVLLDHNANANRSSIDGRTSLHVAAADNSIALLKPLVDAGADVDWRQEDHETPLIAAIRAGHREAVSGLITLGAGVELMTREGYTPLLEALRTSSSDVVRELIDLGANVHASDADGMFAIHHAVLSRSADNVGTVLVAGGDVDAVAHDGSTPLMKAAEGGLVTIVRMLLSSGADIDRIDSDGNNALMRASRTDQPRTAEILLREGIEKSARNAAGLSAKELAKEHRSTRVRKLFKHIKRTHISYIKTGANLAKLSDEQHASSVGGDIGAGFAFALTPRLRLQADLALAFRNTDVDELSGPVTFPNQGDFYYWINTVDVKPVVRFALTNPYRSHLYLLGGAGYSSVLITELRDFAGDADGEEVSETTDSSFTSYIAGLGFQSVLGPRTIVTFEFTAASASSFQLDLFNGSLATYTFGMGLGF